MLVFLHALYENKRVGNHCNIRLIQTEVGSN
jgi:hypothetical protein